jgi:DNA-binding NarL/FixJ family response regulator
MNERLAVALVSGSPLVRAGLRAGLGARGDFEITAEADDLESWRSASPREPAQVVIVDADNADVLAIRPDTWPDTADPAVLLLAPPRHEAIVCALRLGVSVVDARSPIATIAAAAIAAAAGLVVISREQAAAIESAAVFPPERTETNDGDRALEPLTPRERQVLEQMSLGLANREIAQALHISAHTAKFHVAQILAKLDAATRAHAVAKAMRNGLMPQNTLSAKEDALGIS